MAEHDCDPGDEMPPVVVADPPTPSDQGDGSGETTEEDEPC